MKDKLQPGDYVTDLTEEQFDELMDMQPNRFEKMIFIPKITDGICMADKYLDTLDGFHGYELSNKLTFEEFLRRAKNTF